MDQVFKAIDANKDSGLQPSEMMDWANMSPPLGGPAAPHPGIVQQLFNTFDANKDGVWQPNEFRTWATSMPGVLPLPAPPSGGPGGP